MVTYTLSVKEKGRTVLPAALRTACQFTDATELVATPLGRGKFLVETREAIVDDLWAGLPATEESGAVNELMAWRVSSEQARCEQLTAVAISDSTENDPGATLLAELGLQ
jgi:bifunctional DNA-binding transcriptional regulator/antitoxin component of YhaV-PrlF toxin-antitoxin module